MKERINRPGDAQDDLRLERLAWLMDRSIRIGPFSIGLDGLLGLIPGIGDIVGGAVSALIVAKAIQSGLPRIAILRMVANVGIDSLLGAIPLVGDIFDFAYKANVRNVEIYRKALGGRREPLKDWAFIALIALIMLVFIALPILGLIYVIYNSQSFPGVF